jgi:hypothetical protein
MAETVRLQALSVRLRRLQSRPRPSGPGLLFESSLEGPDLLLEPVHAGLQLDQLGPKRHLVEPLFDAPWPGYCSAWDLEGVEMHEYSLMSPRGTPHTLKVEIGGRMALALPGRTVGYLGRMDALRLAHDILRALEPDLEAPRPEKGRPQT